MTQTGGTIELLREFALFADLDDESLDRVRAQTFMRIVGKGEIALEAGQRFDELCFVVQGRLAGTAPAVCAEYGRGDAVEARAFFARSPAPDTLRAVRDTLLMAIGYHDLAAVFSGEPLMRSLFLRAFDGAGDPTLPATATKRPPSRLVICPAGDGSLDPGAVENLKDAFEYLCEVRTLTSRSFGGDLPGAIDLTSNAASHLLLQQELEFDLTTVFAETGAERFTLASIEEADEVLFIGNGRAQGLNSFEKAAVKSRGGRNCRFVLSVPASADTRHDAGWLADRPWRLAQRLDLGDAHGANLCASVIMGEGTSVAAMSEGVHCAAIEGALDALLAFGLTFVAAGGAGSAFVSVALALAGSNAAEAEGVRKSMIDHVAGAGPRPGSTKGSQALDWFLAAAFGQKTLELWPFPLAAVSRPAFDGKLSVYTMGGVADLVRQGLIAEQAYPSPTARDVSVPTSYAAPVHALATALRRLTPAPVTFIRAAPEQDLSLEAPKGLTSRDRVLNIPIPRDIGTSDWASWWRLRQLGRERAEEYIARLSQPSGLSLSQPTTS